MNQLLVVVALNLLQATPSWEPPAKPDPGKIIDEAFADFRAGKYELAFEKHLWFHEHSLDFGSEYYGTRLAPALDGWHELAKVYPPAMTKLRQVQDTANSESQDVGKNLRAAFADAEAINQILGDESRTAEVFIKLSANSPPSAQLVYDLAQPTLIKTKNYKLCGKYLKPDELYSRWLNLYRADIELANKEKTDAIRRVQHTYAEARFLQRAATIVALLALNERDKEAGQFAERLRNDSKDPNRQKVILSALKGELPEQKYGG